MNEKLSKLLTYISIIVLSLLLILYLFSNNIKVLPTIKFQELSNY